MNEWMNSRASCSLPSGDATLSAGAQDSEKKCGTLLGPRHNRATPMDAWFTPALRIEMRRKLAPALAAQPAFMAAAAPLSAASQGFGGHGRALVVAVHVRRGDVTRSDHPRRFLDDSHYIAAIRAVVLAAERLNDDSGGIDDAICAARGRWGLDAGLEGGKLGVSVHVFSEAPEAATGTDVAATGPGFDAYLALDTSRRRHHQEQAAPSAPIAPTQVTVSLHLGAPHDEAALREAWGAFIHADVLVTSKSSFSYVPALYRRPDQATVYAPFWHEPLGEWLVANDGSQEVNDDAHGKRKTERLAFQILERLSSAAPGIDPETATQGSSRAAQEVYASVQKLTPSELSDFLALLGKSRSSQGAPLLASSQGAVQPNAAHAAYAERN
mmetsp:Transcript_63581/g.143431  ORF Transcript_63581/g.143431 Transcript_63581/m.143431 type:complete len:384 (-) Transcript_63581:291-1442(-)